MRYLLYSISILNLPFALATSYVVSISYQATSINLLKFSPTVYQANSLQGLKVTLSQSFTACDCIE